MGVGPGVRGYKKVGTPQKREWSFELNVKIMQILQIL